MSRPAARMLLVAKAPVPGQAKTRLAKDVGDRVAAELAAAAMLDTVRALADAADAAGTRPVLALSGDLSRAVRGEQILEALTDWHVVQQRGADLAARLIHAHGECAALGEGPVLQLGMDTPQVTGSLLLEVTEGLADADAVLGPAEDGGWWVLALRDPRQARVLAGVPMSTARTGALTRAALEADGLRVARAGTLRDVDVAADADAVAAACPADSGFAATWQRVRHASSPEPPFETGRA